MIIYTDAATENKDEIISDAYNLVDVGDGLWEVDCRMVFTDTTPVVLPGANASAEGVDDADDEVDARAPESMLDVVRDYHWEQVEVSKTDFPYEWRGYIRALIARSKDLGKSAEEVKKIQTDADAAFKRIMARFRHYLVFTGRSREAGSLYVWVDYRDDGFTPFAIIFYHGLEAQTT